MKLSELKEYQLHPIRKQMVLLPSLNVADRLEDLDDGETSASKALQMSIAENGILSPIIVCGKTIVDGLRRLEIAKIYYPDDTEIPVKEISESDVLANVIAAITTRRKLTIQQRIFNVYQFVRSDHLKFMAYSAAMKKANLSGQNYDVAVPSMPDKTSGFIGSVQTDYFSKYIGEREVSDKIASPCVWLAQRLGCVSKYLGFLNEIWNYLESLDDAERAAKFNAAVELVNIKGDSLNTVLRGIKGMDSERDAQKEAERNTFEVISKKVSDGLETVLQRISKPEYVAQSKCDEVLKQFETFAFKLPDPLFDVLAKAVATAKKQKTIVVNQQPQQ